MSTTIYHATPIRELVTESNLPTDFVSGHDNPLSSVLDNLYFTDYAVSAESDGYGLNIELVVDGEAALSLPGLEDFAFVIGSDGAGATVINADFFVSDRGVQARLEDITLAVRLPSGLLTPVAENGGPRPRHAEIKAECSITIDENFDVYLEGFDTFNLPPVEIGDTGVIISSDDVMFDLSRTETRPETTAAGFDESFMGIYVGEAQVRLPDKLPSLAQSDLTLENCAIGTGGVSGKLTAEYTPAFDTATNQYTGSGASNLFGLPFGLEAVTIEFHRNVLIASSLSGEILLPFFQKRLGVDVGLDAAGDITARVTAPVTSDDEVDPTTGLVVLKKPGILMLAVESIELGSHDGQGRITLSGTVTPDVADISLPGVRVEKLTVDAAGNIHIDGGWIDLRDQYSVEFHNFIFEISKLGFGTSDDGSKWLGLNGSVKFVDELAAGVSVEGLRVTWDKPDLQSTPTISFTGIGIGFEVPDTLHFEGAVSYEPDTHRFTGDIELNLIALDVFLQAKLVIGTRKEQTYFAIYVEAELARGIPLWGSGLALYGMAGLYAQRMVPNKGHDKYELEEWYDPEFANIPDSKKTSWYHRDELGVTDLDKKWMFDSRGQAFGAGVTIGTASDNGHSFNSRLLFVISFPGPIFLFQGRANILAERARLPPKDPDSAEEPSPQEPPFNAFGVLDTQAGTFQLGMDAKYKTGKNGELLDIHASSEAFYDFDDPLGWHIHIGEKEPRDRRVRARFLELFGADGYFMLDAQQLALGARYGYDANYKFGPLRVNLEAWIEGNALLSFHPVHLHGDLWVHGQVGLKAFGRSANLTVDANLGADATDPYHIKGSFRVKLKLPWPLRKARAKVTLEWGPRVRKNRPSVALPLKEVALEHPKTGTNWRLPRTSEPIPSTTEQKQNYDPLVVPDYSNRWRGEPDTLNPNKQVDLQLEDKAPPSELPIVPMDVRPQLSFNRSVHDDARVGDNVHVVTPETEIIGDPATGEGPMEVRYGLNDVRLSKWVPSNDGNGTWQESKGDLHGVWAPTPRLPQQGMDQLGGADPVMSNTKLSLTSKNPFDYYQHTGGRSGELLDFHLPDYPCLVEDRCYDFADLTIDDFTATHDEVDDVINVEEIAVGPTNKIWTVSRNVATPSDVARPSNVAWPTFRYWDSNRNVEDPLATAPTIASSPAGNALWCKSGTDETIVSIDLPHAFPSIKLTLAVSSDTEQVDVLALDKTGEFHYGWESDLGEYTITNPDSELVKLWIRASAESSHPEEPTEVEIAIAEICGAEYDLLEGLGNSERLEHMHNQISRWYREDEILEPYTIYRLEIDTTVNATGKDILEGHGFEKKLREYAYFRTGGPSGISEFSYPIGTRSPSEFASGLDDLEHYIGSTSPKAIEEAGSRPSLPRPVYRAYDVGVEFDENYVDLMYQLGKRDLGLYLFDQNARPVRDVTGRLITIQDGWSTTGDFILDWTAQRWVETISDCLGIDDSQVKSVIEHNDTLTTTETTAVSSQVLNADTIYEAHLRPLLLREDFATGDAEWRPVTGSANWAVQSHSSFEGSTAIIQEEGETSTIQLDEDFNQFDALELGTDVIRFDADTIRDEKTYVITEYNAAAHTVTVVGNPSFPDKFLWGRKPPSWWKPSSPWTIPARGHLECAAESNETLIEYTGDRTATEDSLSSPNTWSDYRVATTLRAKTARGEVGVTFRKTENDRYRVVLDYANNECRFEPLASDLEPVRANVDLVTGLDYQLVIEAIGSTCGIDLNGERLFTIEDDTAPDGGIGLYCNQMTAVFKAVRVDDFRNNAPSAYDFSFVTSNFANFVHHLHSYQDETWRVVLPKETETELADAQESAAKPTAEEARTYRKIVDNLGLSTTVDQVEVLRLEDSDGTAHAFLLQSPEPIRWYHSDSEITGDIPITTLEVHQALTDLPISTPSEVKLIDVDLGTEESVTLLLRDDLDLTEWTVECYHIDDSQQGKPLVKESFADDLNEWTFIDEPPIEPSSSHWEIVDGELKQTNDIIATVDDPYREPGTYGIIGNTSWMDYQATVAFRSDDDGAIGLLFRYQDTDNFYRFAMDSSHDHRRLTKIVDGKAHLLWESQEGYEVGQEYVLEIKCLGPQLVGTIDGEDLFKVWDDSHPVGQIGLYCQATNQARFGSVSVDGVSSSWQTYYGFEEEHPLPEGTQVRLHQDSTAPPDIPGLEQRPLNRDDSASIRLSDMGTGLRICAPDGRIVHERWFRPDDAYTLVSSKVIRSADGTGVLITVDSDLSAGQYRLALTYNRGEADQKQGGADTLERVMLDIPWKTR